VAEALAKDATTPVHDAYLKDQEEPYTATVTAIGFSIAKNAYDEGE
jgi:hypothetical protein